MAISSFINKDEFQKQFGEVLNAQMMEAAEPLIQKFLKQIEVDMRKSVASNLISFMTSDYDVQIDKNRIMIQLRSQPK